MAFDGNLTLYFLLALVSVGGFGWLLYDLKWADRFKAASRAHAVVATGGPSLRRKGADDETTRRRKKLAKDLKAMAEGRKQAQKFNMSDRVAQAGLEVPPAAYFGLFAGMGLLVFLLAMFFYKAHPFLAMAFGATVAFGLPIWVLNFLRKRRMKAFTAEFPNAMDVIVRGIKSGLPVQECLQIIARESPEPVRSEFRRLNESLAMGVEIEPALNRMYERMPTPEANFFRIVITIQRKSGGNLAEALGNLSAVLRARKMLREKVKALAAEAVASAMIIGSLPVIVMLLVMMTSKGYMDPMFHDPRGQMMLLGCLFWEVMGIMVMRKMINFKY